MRSPAETLLAVQLEQAGIPFESEYRFHPERRWRADAVVFPRPSWDADAGQWRHNRILVEIDGGSWVAGRHTRGKGFAADCEKASAAAILGYRVIRATPEQVDDGTALSWIRQALGIEAAA